MAVVSPRRRPLPDAGPDTGGVLVLTLVFTVVLAFAVLALANYVMTGLRTSWVTTEQVEAIADATASIHYVAERLAVADLPAGDGCGHYQPAAFTPNGNVVAVCVVGLQTGSPTTLDVVATVGSIRVSAALAVHDSIVFVDARGRTTDRSPVAITSWSTTG